MIDIKKKREENGITQEQLAEKVGVRRQAISNIERGLCKPVVPHAKQIGEILNFDWTEFYESSH